MNRKGAHLEGVFLDFPDLIGAYLNGTHLERTYFRWANLSNVDLANADLADANLEGTDLIGAKNLTIDQLSKVKTLYNAKLDPEREIALREKYPALFEKPDE
ncbi:hypothetical protein MSHOH_3712 [Methanosarcina horonobensis HB-1 = JCM 15518]|uniref:Pentapeptide repeat family protein n=1 Tax=Methanosarcina horonobensis HB-1 = JCM 15518 TaxID=1434110 RepID=A0A0E3WV06_9EURY|nr:pentapeptide repeat-containing protein [Methanosarcina horonobensis]AKB80195.1 hypothetical protein MSHOH_3712 [Methanosarcina horonobensis HB-1 = JCM 15518]